jgi:hypothetical protein
MGQLPRSLHLSKDDQPEGKNRTGKAERQRPIDE